MADPLIIKICGIKTEVILDAAIEAGADMVGLMHFPRSPRHLELDPIGELISLARGRIETCVVLFNPDNTLVAQVAALGPDWIQLHGPETPHRVEASPAANGWSSSARTWPPPGGSDGDVLRQLRERPRRGAGRAEPLQVGGIEA